MSELDDLSIQLQNDLEDLADNGPSGAHELVAIRGTVAGDKIEVLDSSASSLEGGLAFDEQQHLYAVRDALQYDALSRGKTMTELRYAVRTK